VPIATSPTFGENIGCAYERAVVLNNVSLFFRKKNIE